MITNKILEDKLNILVTGYYEQKNLGDDLFVNIAQHIFPNKIFKHKINRIEYIKIEDINSQNIFVNCDKLILFGGEVLNDYFLDRILEFKLKNPYTEYYAIGVSCNQDYKLIQNKLNVFDRIILRNKKDYEYLKPILGEYCNYAPDIVFLNKKINKINLCKTHKNIGFFFAQPLYFNLSDSLKKEYIKNIRLCIDFWLNKNYNIYFFPMCWNSKQSEDDINIIDKVIESYSLIQKTKFKYFINNTSVIKYLPSMKYIFCWRFHSVVLSILYNKPFIAVSDTPKVINILNDSNLNELTYNVSDLVTASNYLINNSIDIKKKIKNIKSLYCSLANKIYLDKNLYNTKRLTAPFYINRNDCDKIIKHIVSNYKKNYSSFDNDYNTELILFNLTKTLNSEYFYGLRNKIHENNIDFLISDIQWLINDLIIKNNIYFYITAGEILNKPIIYNNNKIGINIHYINQFDMQGLHRSGWCFVLESLLNKHNSNSILCDFYVDRTFHWNNTTFNQLKVIPYTVPWIGFIHHTTDEDYSDYNTTNLFNKKQFIESLKFCKGLIVLSNELKNKLEYLLQHKNINVKVFKLTHPTEFVCKEMLFTIDKFKKNNNKKIIQIGAWMRDINGIFNLEIDNDLKIQKYALIGKKMESYYNSINYNNHNNHNHNISCISRDKKKGNININKTVNIINYLNNNDFDLLLTNNIVFLKLISASAVNTLIECVVRNTPIVINKLPAIVEILGNNYPLFYNEIEEVKSLLTIKNIENAYNYIKNLDKSNLNINYFINEFDNILTNVN